MFEKYAENGVITPEKLKLFLNEEQKEENATLADAEQIVAHQLAKESHLFSKPKHGLTLDSFFQYLLDPSINGAMNTKVSLPGSHDFLLLIEHVGFLSSSDSFRC